MVSDLEGSRRTVVAEHPEHLYFGPVWSPDGEKIAFCRTVDGDVPELWIMDADGGNQKFLTNGEQGMGAKYPRFL